LQDAGGEEGGSLRAESSLQRRVERFTTATGYATSCRLGACARRRWSWRTLLPPLTQGAGAPVDDHDVGLPGGDRRRSRCTGDERRGLARARRRTLGKLARAA
jgi:hypothetical protein